MGDGVEARMNVAAVRRVDPYASDIVDTSAHVALYSFDDNEWIKTEIEGALFLYSRRGPPAHSILVMNRLSTDNLIEPVTRGLELQLQEPFLLYRNSRRRIYGLWFYDRDECARVAAKIDALVKASRDKDPDPSPNPRPPVDIFTMLSKAQNDYNSNRALSTAAASAPPRPPDVASQSVVDFFLKAGGQAAPPPAPFVDPVEDPMTLQRLMSDPVRTLEHIEKQQRSATPRCDDPAKKAAADGRRKNGKPEPKPQGQGPKQGGRSRTAQKAEAEPEPSLPAASTPATGGRARPKPPDPDPDGVRPTSTPTVAPETPQKPALMPPTMFTSSATKANAAGVGRAPRPPAEAPAPEFRPEPLTRNQLLQALNYMIKNDADFVTKLHEAYVKSFSELVS